MALHDLLAAKRVDIMQRWMAQVQGTLAPESMPAVELINHMPQFLGEILAALREDSGLTSVGPSPEDSPSAAGHGEQRLRLGFSLDSVVREYGALRTAIIDTAKAAGVQVTLRELEVVSAATISGIAHAVSEYSRQRDAELMRHANEHFAFIAHELRNPLGSARVAFELLKTKGQVPAEGQAVAALERGLQQVSELINETLQVAQVASGVALRKQWTTLKMLLEEAEGDAIAEAEAKGVELRLTVEKDQKVHLDRRLVRSALGNLVRNGVKYPAPGGVVEVRAQIANERAVLEVEDCCGGLPPGKVEEAFAPFVRFDKRQGGFGLGLAIAKQAVDAHGGSIRIQNLPDKGCIFVLELPVEVPGDSSA